MEAFHWHGDTFHLPSGCLRIAESEACRNQAFLYDERVVGLQFHLEVTRQGAEELILNCGEDIREGPFIQTADAMLSDEKRFAKINGVMERLLDKIPVHPPER